LNILTVTGKKFSIFNAQFSIFKLKDK